MREHIFSYGVPKKIAMDNELSLNSASIPFMLNYDLKINVRTTPTYRGEANGQEKRCQITATNNVVLSCYILKFSSFYFERGRSLLNLFIFDFQPFSVVDDSGFKAFFSALNPSYQLPSKHSISKTAIPAMHEECKQMKEIIEKGNQFCVTTDFWTSINAVSYIAVTAHFLDENVNICSLLLECHPIDIFYNSENFASELLNIVEKWEIQEKILLLVSYNAVNIKNAKN